MNPGQPVRVIKEGLYFGDEGTIEAIKGDKRLVKFKETATYFLLSELEANGEPIEQVSKIRTLFKGLPNTR